MLQRSEQQGLLQTLEYEDANVQFSIPDKADQLALEMLLTMLADFINNEPFIIALGDSIIIQKK